MRVRVRFSDGSTTDGTLEERHKDFFIYTIRLDSGQGIRANFANCDPLDDESRTIIDAWKARDKEMIP